MGKSLDYEKFFNVGQTAGEITKTITKTTPPELQGVQSLLNDFNKTMGLVNNTLGTLGIDSSFFKDKLKEKIGGMQNKQEIINTPYVETFRSPAPIQEQEPQQEKTINKKMEFEKLINMLDLVISLKGEKCTLKEVKLFAEENKNLIEGIL